MTLSTVPHLVRLLALSVSLTVSLAAEGRTAIEPPVTAWRPPTLQVQGAEEPVRMQSLKLDVEVSGGVAQTRVEMVFFNPNPRTLEGKLQFPLAPGQVVSGFALDVDGRLRDAVPVEKAKAQQVFEDIARRRVDPGLLQTTLGNNHELRIYPLLGGKTRTVVLTIVESASGRLQVPLAYAERVDRVELAVRYPVAKEAPSILAGRPPSLRFRSDPSGGFSASWSAREAVLPRDPLRVAVQGGSGDDVAVATQSRDGTSYFTIELPVATRRAPRPLPSRVQIVWDASGSGAQRRVDRELTLLDAYFARARNVSVSLVRVADAVSPPSRFEVRGGDWTALRRELESTTYDGASNLGAVRHDGAAEEALWFSDGLSTYGAPWRIAFPVRVFAINSATSSDPAALQALADATGGSSIDLGRLSVQAAADALLTRTSALDGRDAVSAVGASDIVLESRTAASGRFVLAGRLTEPTATATATVRIRAASGRTSHRTVRVETGRNDSSLAALQWARLTIASLEGEAHAHKPRIRELGKQFGLATRETSLLVLEQVDDYVTHGIEPPAELRAAYEQLAARRHKRAGDSDAARLAQVVRRFEARVAWWNRDFPKDRPPAPLSIARGVAGAVAGMAASASPFESRSRLAEAARQDSATSRDASGRAAAPAATPAPVLPASLAARRENGPPVAAKSLAPNDGRSPPSIGIALTPAASASETLRRLRAAPPDQWMRIYLDERRAAPANVGFFLDAAEFFLTHGQRAQGLRALSNLAELDLQNRQILRLLAYRLQQAGEIELALPIFERVLDLAPNEPQSHRDLGLALGQAGEAQRAVDRLYKVVTGAWDARFADIDLIALAEMNAVVDRSRREGTPVDVSAIDRRLLRNLPVDLRVVLAWDADNTDVDLHVIDPNGDEVFYGRSLSHQGGTITRDATGGYGPEEFVLKEAKPGKYRVEAQFFGHRQQVLTTSTGLMLWLSSGFAREGQKDERATIRVRSTSGERVVVGEFEVKP